MWKEQQPLKQLHIPRKIFCRITAVNRDVRKRGFGWFFSITEVRPSIRFFQTAGNRDAFRTRFETVLKNRINGLTFALF